MTSREEELLQVIINGDDVSGWKCRSRVEEYLLKCCCGETCDGMKPKTRIEALLKQLAEKMASGGGGSGGDVPSGDVPIDYGMIHEGKYRIRYFDTDGTILKIEYVENGGKLTPPDAPNYDPDYLIFDEWNYDIENYIVEQPTDVGAIYKTVNDITYMFCNFTKNNYLNPKLAISNFTSIDWGDGTVDTNNSHTYAEQGEYLIKISGDFNFNTGSGAYLLGSSNLDLSLSKIYIKNGITKIENNAFKYAYHSLKHISIPNSVTTIGSQAFYNCYTLTYISIPNSVTTIGSQAFGYCHSLKHISIPNSVTTIDAKTFIKCYSLKHISIPNSVITINAEAFSECYTLTDISIPNSVTTIGNYAFGQCYSITYISIPNSVTTIGSQAFYNCYSIIDYLINCSSVPTLTNTNAFNNISRVSTIWVNDDIIEDLKVATNWSTYASYMKPLSQYPNL